MNREKLKNSIKKVADWTTPPRFQRIIHNNTKKIRGNIYCEKEVREKIKENKQYKNIHQGERCFILCTGPSIKKMDLSALKHETCIAVSLFSLHKNYAEINPDYHIMAPFHPPFHLLCQLFVLFCNFGYAHNRMTFGI